MRIENTINKVKEFLLWIYILAVLSGIVYAACMGQETNPPVKSYTRKLIHDSY